MSEQSTNGPTVSNTANTANITSGVNKEKNPRRVAAGKKTTCNIKASKRG